MTDRERANLGYLLLGAIALVLGPLAGANGAPGVVGAVLTVGGLLCAGVGGVNLALDLIRKRG